MSSINEEEILRIIGDGKILHTLIRSNLVFSTSPYQCQEFEMI